LYDETGQAGAILDEFCIRNLAGVPAGWVFGLSVFGLQGEHIGWFEDGVLFDVENRAIGFVLGAKGLSMPCPPLSAPPEFPRFAKRPHCPSLRGRPPRRSRSGWSHYRLADYLEQAGHAQALGGPFIPRQKSNVVQLQR
jgi:hypothetical protein